MSKGHLAVPVQHGTQVPSLRQPLGAAGGGLDWRRPPAHTLACPQTGPHPPLPHNLPRPDLHALGRGLALVGVCCDLPHRLPVGQPAGASHAPPPPPSRTRQAQHWAARQAGAMGEGQAQHTPQASGAARQALAGSPHSPRCPSPPHPCRVARAGCVPPRASMAAAIRRCTRMSGYRLGQGVGVGGGAGWGSAGER